jgi:16S rRNA (guanine966-N2)-methyltransferase
LLSIWRGRIPGSRFLDLYAGSGAVGFEAWGAGASRVCLVEQAPRVLAVLARNRRAVAPACEIVRGRLPEALGGRPAGDFDLIFADPPYAYERYPELVEAAARRLAPGGELAVEHSARAALPEAAGEWRRRDRRCYGESWLSFYGAADRG